MDRPSRLSAAFVRTVSNPGRYGDGRGGYGLSLLVKPRATEGIAKSWSQRLWIRSRRVNIGLGRYPVVTLAAARNASLERIQPVWFWEPRNSGLALGDSDPGAAPPSRRYGIGCCLKTLVKPHRHPRNECASREVSIRGSRTGEKRIVPT